MIKDLKHVEPKHGEPHWRGTLVAQLGGRPISIRGWRWDGDKSVRPPQARWGNRTVDVVPTTPELESEVVKLFEYASMQPEARIFNDALREFDRDPAAAKLHYPHLYRACFLARNGAEWASEFANLPEGRLWPDRMLKAVCIAVREGKMPAEELKSDIEREVLSRADAARVREFLEEAE